MYTVRSHNRIQSNVNGRSWGWLADEVSVDLQ